MPLVRRMAETLRHRGPDDDGFHVSPHCVLGHRRLKIIDLSPLGRQPMSNEDGSVWVSFNGEIYNYLDLRAELLRTGHTLRSQSDTEVLVHLYEAEGDSFLQRLNGMFALALWDERRRRLLLARDRFGKKPLYYFFDGKRLLFGSEPKAVLADESVPREIDREALSQYLALGYIPCPRTIFKGIRKLPPASCLVVELDREGARLLGPERYWELRYCPDATLTEEDCVDQIRHLIRDAVRIRMYSDVPLGAFLSGGLDSSTVVAGMVEVAERPVETFSIGFDQESHDELPFAERVARHLGTNHHTFRCRPDALEVLPTLVHHYDEPFADSSAVPTYYVSKIAREHVTVALSGDGGDEIFAGYTRYDSGLQRWQFARSFVGGVAQGALRVLSELYPKELRGWGILYRHSLPPVASYVADLSIYQPVQRHALLRSQTGDTPNGVPLRLFEELARKAGSSDFLSQMQYMDQMVYLPDDILVKVDRASMAVSLETRAPLLDYRLAELMATVPDTLRYREDTRKYLLKKAVAGRLPDEIIYRSKMGFAVPLKDWFRQEAGDFAHETLLSQRARERGFFQTAEVRRLLEGHRASGRDFASKIWALLFFELWCQTWLDQPVPANCVSEHV